MIPTTNFILFWWRFGITEVYCLPTVVMSLPSTTSCMIARSSAYAYFLEVVVGKSEI